MYDIFFIGNTHQLLKERFPTAKQVESLDSARKQTLTKMFWLVWSDVVVSDNFNFTYKADEYSLDVPHVFLNGEYFDGVYLFPSKVECSTREIEYRFLTHKKEVDIVASNPLEYNKIFVKTYEDYVDKLKDATSEFVWIIPDDVIVEDDFKFNYQVPMWEKDAVHVFKNKEHYDGIFICHKNNVVSQKEFDHKFFLKKKEVDIVASNPKPFDVFYVDSWDDYEHAFKNSSTEMFWAVSHNLKYSMDYIKNFYFSHHNSYDRRENHAFVHRVDDKDLYNGVFLCSKNKPLSKREIEYRFLVNAKQWDDIVSEPRKYEIYTVGNYQEYLDVLERCPTEMFWMIPPHVQVCDDYEFDMYFSHDNEYDRKINHVFKNGEYYDGVILCSKHASISEREFKYRFITNKKEHDIIVSNPLPYDKFYVNDYNDYCDALEKSTTDFLWVIPTNVDVLDTFEFNYQLPAWERDVIHVFKNGEHNDGIFVCHKDLKISKREFEYYWFMKKNEVDVQASTPQPYDIVFISYQEPNADENYAELCERFPRAKRVHGVKGIHQAHIAAAKECDTDMIWIVDGDAVIVDDFNFDYQVPKWQRDQVYVWRSQNPVNDMVYGYGGVKLFPRKETINMDTSKPDMTTSISPKFNAVKEISNITAFNTGPFETWKSAFRECCKLSSKVIDRQKSEETDERLKIWTTIGRDKKFGEYALAGARAGMMYGTANKGNVEALKKINDFEWLKEQFNGDI